MKVAVVGLPIFAKRLCESLNAYLGKKTFFPFDTYYSKKDKLVFLLMVSKMDAVLSINGEITNSKVFDLTIKHRKPLIIFWVGTDVLNSTEKFKKGHFKQEFIDYPHHFCCSLNLVKEVKEMGIDAPYINYITQKNDEVPKPFKELKILTRIGRGRELFYGINKIIELAKLYSEITFTIVGISNYNERTLPPNIKCIYWTDQMNKLYQSHSLSIRLPDHDGLSAFVLEALSFGNHVCYNNELPHTHHSITISQVKNIIDNLQNELNSTGEIQPNLNGYEYIKNEYNPNKVNSEIITLITNLLKK